MHIRDWCMCNNHQCSLSEFCCQKDHALVKFVALTWVSFFRFHFFLSTQSAELDTIAQRVNQEK